MCLLLGIFSIRARGLFLPVCKKAQTQFLKYGFIDTKVQNGLFPLNLLYNASDKLYAFMVLPASAAADGVVSYEGQLQLYKFVNNKIQHTTTIIPNTYIQHIRHISNILVCSGGELMNKKVVTASLAILLCVTMLASLTPQVIAQTTNTNQLSDTNQPTTRGTMAYVRTCIQ